MTDTNYQFLENQITLEQAKENLKNYRISKYNDIIVDIQNKIREASVSWGWSITHRFDWCKMWDDTMNTMYDYFGSIGLKPEYGGWNDNPKFVQLKFTWY